MAKPRRLRQGPWQTFCAGLLRAFGVEEWVVEENDDRMSASADKVGVNPAYIGCDRMDLARYKFEEDLDGQAYCAGQLYKYGFSLPRLMEYAMRCTLLRMSAAETTPKSPR